jgi:hypothetical protein
MIERAHLDALRRRFGPMRMISFALTPEQCRARTKTETRRTGWGFARERDKLLGVSKVMGFRKGESITDVAELFGVIEIERLYREPLNSITQESVTAEGFPDLTPEQFVERFLAHARNMLPRDLITVVRFRWLT